MLAVALQRSLRLHKGSLFSCSLSTMSLLKDVLVCSVTAANKASRLVQSILKHGDLAIVEKENASDLQTEADRTAQKSIVSTLHKAFPNLAIIGEEDQDDAIEESLVAEAEFEGDVRSQLASWPSRFNDIDDINRITVWVDPLDGTKEFTEGLLDHVTILIGIALDGRAVAGVIHQPFFNFQLKDSSRLGRVIYGVVDGPVIGISRQDSKSDQRVVTTTRSHGSGLINDCAAACKPTEVIRVGGAGHKVLLLIEGKADVYVFPSPGCKKWDTCAPEAILHAVGGKLSDVWGNTYLYFKDTPVVNEWGTLAASNEKEHQECLQLLPDKLKAQVKDYFKNRKKK